MLRSNIRDSRNTIILNNDKYHLGIFKVYAFSISVIPPINE